MRVDDLTTYQFAPEYRTGSSNDPQKLMKSAFQRSCLYKRASGYFSSSVLNLFKEETLAFAKAGGKINLMCSPVMSESDLNEISLGYDKRNIIDGSIIEEISQLSLHHEVSQELSFLSSLIYHSVLEIKLIFFENGSGIFHDKSGYFRDTRDNVLGFMGSANESSSAFSGAGNFERLSVFLSWEPGDISRCINTQSYIDELWNGQVRGLAVVDFPSVAKDRLLQFARKNLDDFEGIIHQTLQSKQVTKTLMPHQIEALENWNNSAKRGILKHATGSGKTITAIAAIREHVKLGAPSLVLVPSKLLLDQWYYELKTEIDNVLILRCGAGHTSWKKANMLREICQVMPADELGAVILAVNDTAVSSEFMRQLSNSKNTLLVADEVHALGSHENSKIMEKDFAFRLGLSATPERYRDPEGTQKLFNFFNGIVKPEVSLMDALRAGRLVPYNYFPLLTYLSADEEEAWISLTNKIINYLRMNEIDATSFNKDTRLSSMLINRARIAKKATSKVSTVIETILENYNEGEHWLIYCEDRYQLGEINDQIADSDINTFIYMSNMEGSAQGELDAFTRQSGILLSIRCLDEGVDIPIISHAIIAASSQNPRQFIQRRGRVLRKTEGKLNAVIYDCIVVPANSTDETKFDGLIVSEVRRAIEFAQTARNSSYADSTLRNILISVGSDPDSVMDEIDGDREIEY